MQEVIHMLVKDVMVEKCMMDLFMPLNLVLLLDQNIHMLVLIKHATFQKLKLDIHSLVMLMLNHKIQLLMLKLQQNMHFQLVLMLVELISNFIRVVYIANHVMVQ